MWWGERQVPDYTDRQAKPIPDILLVAFKTMSFCIPCKIHQKDLQWVCFLSDLKQLISFSGIEAKKNVVVTQADQMGPLPSTLIKSVDWLLIFSLFFLISFITYATIRTESIRWLIPGQEQEHVEQGWTERSQKEEFQSFISEINAAVSHIFSSEMVTFNLSQIKRIVRICRIVQCVKKL